MHSRVKLIFEEHDAWLKAGGDHGIPGVQRSNLAQVIDKHLNENTTAVFRSTLRLLDKTAGEAKLSDEFRRLIEVLAPTGALSKAVEPPISPKEDLVYQQAEKNDGGTD